MKKMMINYGGLVLFYLVIILGVLLLNLRFSYLNSFNDKNVSEYLTMND